MKKQHRKSNRPVIEELEPRILYSADLNPALFDGGPLALSAEVRQVEVSSAVQQAAVQVEQRRHEVVLIDPRVENYQQFIDDLHAQGTRDVDVILLRADQDGVAQISSALAQEHDVSAVHIISHAIDGEVQIGSAPLNFDSLLKNAKSIASWKYALTDNADVLFYGCDLAATEQGQALLNSVARLTGADVEASVDLTGNAAKGGNWNLEYRTGAIETSSAVSQSLQWTWSGTLATYTVTNTNDTGAGSPRQAILNANGSAEIGRASCRERVYSSV